MHGAIHPFEKVRQRLGLSYQLVLGLEMGLNSFHGMEHGGILNGIRFRPLDQQIKRICPSHAGVQGNVIKSHRAACGKVAFKAVVHRHTIDAHRSTTTQRAGRRISLSIVD